jgi:hypothetical protein
MFNKCEPKWYAFQHVPPFKGSWNLLKHRSFKYSIVKFTIKASVNCSTTPGDSRDFGKTKFKGMLY